ncbi:MAG: hypothetical protein AAF585_09295, partial [Verrucomicrobiota bacterium]
EQLNAIIRGVNNNPGGNSNREPQTPPDSNGPAIRPTVIQDPEDDSNDTNNSQTDSTSATTTDGAPEPS